MSAQHKLGRPLIVQKWIDTYQNARVIRGDKPHADCCRCGYPHDKHLLCGMGSTFGSVLIGGQTVEIDASNVESMQQFIAKKPSGFHWRNDIYFAREQDAVRVTQIEFFREIYPHWKSWLIPIAEWESIVGSVTIATATGSLKP